MPPQHSGENELRSCPFCGATPANYHQWSNSAYGTCDCGAGYRKDANQNAHCWKLLAEKDGRELNLQEALSASLHREHDLKTVLADKQIEIATLQGRVAELSAALKEFLGAEEMAHLNDSGALSNEQLERLQSLVEEKPTDPQSVSDTNQESEWRSAREMERTTEPVSEALRLHNEIDADITKLSRDIPNYLKDEKTEPEER